MNSFIFGCSRFHRRNRFLKNNHYRPKYDEVGTPTCGNHVRIREYFLLPVGLMRNFHVSCSSTTIGEKGSKCRCKKKDLSVVAKKDRAKKDRKCRCQDRAKKDRKCRCQDRKCRCRSLPKRIVSVVTKGSKKKDLSVVAFSVSWRQRYQQESSHRPFPFVEEEFTSSRFWKKSSIVNLTFTRVSLCFTTIARTQFEIPEKTRTTYSEHWQYHLVSLRWKPNLLEGTSRKPSTRFYTSFVWIAFSPRTCNIVPKKLSI